MACWLVDLLIIIHPQAPPRWNAPVRAFAHGSAAGPPSSSPALSSPRLAPKVRTPASSRRLVHLSYAQITALIRLLLHIIQIEGYFQIHEYLETHCMTAVWAAGTDVSA